MSTATRLVAWHGDPALKVATVDSEVNRRWGEVNGKGQNWLGQILMAVRDELRK